MKKLTLLTAALAVIAVSMVALEAGSLKGNSDFTTRLHDIEKRVKQKDTGLPPGTIVLSLNNECPAGFARVESLEGRFIKGAGATETVGSKGGSPTHSHKTTVDIAHQHEVRGVTDRPRFMGFGKGGKEFDRVADDNHQHEFRARTEPLNLFDSRKTVTTETASSEPPFAAVLFCAKL